MKFYWHESGKTAWSVFGTMLFCLIWYMCGLFIQIELNSLFQREKKGCLLQKGYLSFTLPLGILKRTVRILLLGAVCCRPNPYKEIKQKLEEKSLEAVSRPCGRWPQRRVLLGLLKISRDPFHHSLLMLLRHVKVWICTSSKGSVPTSINTFWAGGRRTNQ